MSEHEDSEGPTFFMTSSDTITTQFYKEQGFWSELQYLLIQVSTILGNLRRRFGDTKTLIDILKETTKKPDDFETQLKDLRDLREKYLIEIGNEFSNFINKLKTICDKYQLKVEGWDRQDRDLSSEELMERLEKLESDMRLIHMILENTEDVKDFDHRKVQKVRQLSERLLKDSEVLINCCSLSNELEKQLSTLMYYLTIEPTSEVYGTLQSYALPCKSVVNLAMAQIKHSYETMERFQKEMFRRDKDINRILEVKDEGNLTGPPKIRIARMQQYLKMMRAERNSLQDAVTLHEKELSDLKMDNERLNGVQALYKELKNSTESYKRDKDYYIQMLDIMKEQCLKQRYEIEAWNDFLRDKEIEKGNKVKETITKISEPSSKKDEEKLMEKEDLHINDNHDYELTEEEYAKWSLMATIKLMSEMKHSN